MKANFTYDPNLKPFYESKIMIDNKSILLFDMDSHQYNTMLGKMSYIVEYYTPNNECIIIPKYIAQKLFFEDDKVLEAYFKTQNMGRDRIEKSKNFLRAFTVFFIFLTVFNYLLQLFTFNSYYLIGIYAVVFLFVSFPYKNKIVKKSFTQFIQVINNKVDSTILKSNLEDITEYIRTISYLTDNNKVKFAKHFKKMSNLIK